MRTPLSAFLRTRPGRAAVIGTAALFTVTCHSEPTATCTPTNLVITAQPASVAAGTALSLTAEARDNSGNLETCFDANVNVALGTNPGSATLSGTTTARAAAGIASFAGLSITKAAAGYTLVVSSTGLAAGQSGAFTISAGPANALTINTQPTNA